MGDEHRMTNSPSQSGAALARDAALARVGRTRRWVIAGAAALTAGFAALVSAVAPGKSLVSTSHARTAAATAAPSTRGTGSAIPTMPPPANPGDLGLQGPGQPPTAAPSQPQPQSAPSQQAQPTPPAAAPQSSGGGGAAVSGGS
jgi:hypothetical protein